MVSELIAESVLHTIGRTPVVRLRHLVEPGSAAVLVKLEYYNPTGSYKDRMALAMIEGAEARGDAAARHAVVEFTGGSTGSSLAFVCAAKGYQFASSPPTPSRRRSCARWPPSALTAHVVPATAASHPRAVRPHAGEVDAARGRARHVLDRPVPQPGCARGYTGIGRELLEQTGGAVDAFCGAVGTGGMLRASRRRSARAAHGARSSRWSRRLAAMISSGSAARTASRASRPASGRRSWRTRSTTRRARVDENWRARWRAGWRARKASSPARRAG